MNRRPLLAALMLAPWAATPARAQAPTQIPTWPTKPIRIVAPFSPGGAPDILARLFAQEMSASLGNTFVENKGGAGGNVGADAVAKSPPDGHSLLLTTTATHAINPALYASMPYDALRDFSPIGTVALTPLMAAVSAKVMPDLMSGRVSVMFNSIAALAPFVRDGKLRALAVSTPRRLPGWPEVPTMDEAGLAGFEASAWYAFYGPAGMNAEVVQRLNREIVRIIDLPATRERYATLGLEPLKSSPAELAELTRRDLEKWTRVIRAKGIRAE